MWTISSCSSRRWNDAGLRDVLRYFPNSSLYAAGDRLRYVETRLHEKARSHHLVALEPSEALEATLARARGGARRGELAAALVDDDITLEEANAFVGELVESQVLVSHLAVP
jgi:hypothetical protein